MGMVLGHGLRVLAARFGFNSQWPLWNHENNHLTATQRAAILCAVKPSEIDLEQLQRSESEGLLGALVGQRARLQQLLEAALGEGSHHVCVSVERAITSNLELVAKLLGELRVHHEVKHTSLLISPDYIRMRQALVQALQPYPEASLAVSQTLAAMEADAARDITANAKKGRPLLIDATPLEEAAPC